MDTLTFGHKMKKIKTNSLNSFYSETFKTCISESQENVKEAVIIEDIQDYSPSVFLYFFDKKFYHISLKTKQVLDVGMLKSEDAQHFQVMKHQSSVYITYLSQYQLNFLDITKKCLNKSIFKINIPTQPQMNLSDEQKQILSTDGFKYLTFDQKGIIVTTEVIQNQSKNLVVCTLFKNNDFSPFAFSFHSISRQITLTKLDSIGTIAIFENHHPSLNGICEFIFHTHDITQPSSAGHRAIKIPMKDGSCVLSARYFGNDKNRLMLVGNDKQFPFVRIFSVPKTHSRQPVRIITDLSLSELYSTMITKVLRADDSHILYEKVSETGTFIEFIGFHERKTEYQKRIQHLRNSYSKNKETEFWMSDEELKEMSYFYKDNMYVSSLYASSNNTLLFIDDHDQENLSGSKKNFDLILNCNRYVKKEMLILFLMIQKGLISQYSEFEIKNCIDMLLEDEKN